MHLVFVFCKFSAENGIFVMLVSSIKTRMAPWADMLYFNGGTIDFEKAIVLTWTSQCISMNK